jgi:AcrR family transcriptional regulator
LKTVSSKATPSRRNDTRSLLLKAAAAEFNKAGFDGTDSNRIARRAGFAPQTFYRWFQDKAEIFIEVYHQWQAEEVVILRELLSVDAADAAVADACVTHHRKYLKFRRSLRSLSYEDQRVRDARAESRKKQIAFVRSLQSASSGDEASIASALLQIERLSDALAESEFDDMGLADTAAKAALAEIIHRLRR